MNDSPQRDIYDYCLYLLSKRAYSTFKITRKLKQKKYPANEIEIVVKLLTAENFLRDDVYAEGRARTFIAKGNSLSQVKRMLSLEKLSLTEERLKQLLSDENKTEEDQMEKLLDTQLRKSGKPPKDWRQLYKWKQKILAGVYKKGHDISRARSLLEKRCAELSG